MDLHQRWCRKLTAGLLLIALPVCTGTGRAADGSDIRKGWETQAKLYKRTRVELDKRSVSVRDRFKHLYRYVAEKSRQDQERNDRLAAKCAEKAGELRDEDKSAKYVKAAKAFKRCAQYNVQVWEAHQKGDSATMTEALDGIVKMEQVIADAIGKCPRRDWLTPGELSKYIRIQDAQKEARKRKG